MRAKLLTEIGTLRGVMYCFETIGVRPHNENIYRYIELQQQLEEELAEGAKAFENEVSNIWIGSYSEQQNAYDVDTLEKLCETNLKNFKKGFTNGFIPLVIGISHRDACANLDKLRIDRALVFNEFIDAICDTLKSKVGEDTEVLIKDMSDFPVGDACKKMAISIVPPEYKEKTRPFVDLMSHYTAYAYEYMKCGDSKSAINMAADKIISEIDELWEITPECLDCSESNE